jgi:hypothetical protein
MRIDWALPRVTVHGGNTRQGRKRLNKGTHNHSQRSSLSAMKRLSSPSVALAMVTLVMAFASTAVAAAVAPPARVPRRHRS